MMKFLTLILSVLLLFLSVWTQELVAQERAVDAEPFRPLVERLEAFGKNIPQEKVYVHMDNTCYFQGDTIWFTAYTRQTNTGEPSTVSGVLYVELLNNDGYLVERKLVEMKEGRGNGFFDLNNYIQYSGFYELRAYTRWQLNWGEHEREHPASYGLMFRDKETEREYFRDYDKLYSRVFPVYDKPLSPGDYSHDMTLRVMQRTFKKDIDVKEKEPVLSLFPEGGNLIAGVENRVAFEAAMTDGEQLEGVLRFGNDSVKTVNRGRGTFTLIPEKGMEREVTFTATDGSKVSAKLPKPEETGVAVQVMQEGGSIVITTGVADLDVDSLAMTIMHEGRTIENSRFKVDKIKINKEGWAPGIYQLTVFDAQGRVWADRLFFVTRPDMWEPTLTVSGMKNEYHPYEKVEIAVSAKGKESAISLAVRDVQKADALFDNGNIMTEMLLSSEIKGFIPNPGWYFEKDDEEHRKALDLLMMTQGWRRFVWRDMAIKGEWDFTQPNERAPIMRGTVSFNPDRITRVLEEDLLTDGPDARQANHVNEKAMQNPAIIDYKSTLAQAKKAIKPGLIVHAELVDAFGKDAAVCEEPTKGEHFQMQLPKFYGNSVFFLSVADTTGWKKREKPYTWVQMAGTAEEYALRVRKKLDLEDPDYRVYISWPYPRFVKPFDFYQSHVLGNEKAAENDIPVELLADTVRKMREVSVSARRKNRLKGFNDAFPAFAVDAYEAWNTIEDAGVPVFNAVDIADAMVRVYLNDYGVAVPPSGENRRILLRYGLSPTKRSLPQYIDIPVDSLYHPKYLTSVTQNFSLSPEERREFYGDERINEDPRFLIDRFIVYTDYQPRHEGSDRYKGANRPETRVVVYPFYDGGKRAVYRDRHYVLQGFSYPEEFYSPDYSKQTPPEPSDYRRTLYWNPDLKLNEKGEATVTFYNNCRTTRLSIEAEGQASDGTLLWNKTE